MTDKEILANLKKSYNNLVDIRENGCNDHCNGQLSNYYQELLSRSIYNISSLYSDLYKSMNLEELKISLDKIFHIENRENICDIRLSSSIDGDYEIVYNSGDSDFVTCVDVDYSWYDDYEYLTEETRTINNFR